MNEKPSPLLTVIMSVYNDAQYLENAILSVLNQSYRNFEFLITNDCSTDYSSYIIDKYAIKDKRIKVYHNQSNYGLTKSLNNMISKAKGDYIVRMDADDICLPKRFEKQVSVFLNKHTDVVFGSTVLIDSNGKKLCESWRPKKTKKILSLLPFHNYIPHPTVMVKSELMKQYKYDTRYKVGQDHNLWRRMNNNNVKFYYLNEPIIKYRINPSSVRADKNKSYQYKLAGVLLSNKQRLLTLKRLRYLKKQEKVLIILRFFVPKSGGYLFGLLKRSIM